MGLIICTLMLIHHIRFRFSIKLLITKYLICHLCSLNRKTFIILLCHDTEATSPPLIYHKMNSLEFVKFVGSNYNFSEKYINHLICAISILSFESMQLLSFAHSSSHHYQCQGPVYGSYWLLFIELCLNLIGRVNAKVYQIEFIK